MKSIATLILAALAALVAVTPAAARAGGDPIPVVTTIPDLADIVRRVGGDRVEVRSITRGRENLHAVSARPSHLVALSRAQMYVQVGLSLETAFAPALLEGARNRDLLPGRPGFVNVSEGWKPIDVPESLSRAGGDVHPHGNPHLNLDPAGGRHAAARVLEGLIRIEPSSRARFEENHRRYLVELDRAEARWKRLGRRLNGLRVVTYHEEFDYLAKAHGFEIAATVEAKPGIPPTPKHLAEVISLMRSEEIDVILTAAWSVNREVERVADATGARVVVLPNQAGGSDATATWIGMMDEIHRLLAEAFDLEFDPGT